MVPGHFQKQVEASICVTMEMVKDALDQLRGAVMIVYPMGLPPYDPIRMEFENKEDLSGTQVRGSRAFWKVSSRLPKEQEPLRFDPPLLGVGVLFFFFASCAAFHLAILCFRAEV